MRKNYLVLALFLVYFTITAAVYFLPFDVPNRVFIRNILFLVAPLAAFLASLFASFTYGIDSLHGKSIFWIALGLLAWLIGEILWVYFEFVLEIDPYPSAADFFYIVAYFPIFWGLIREVILAKVNWGRIDKKLLSLLVLIAFFLSLGVSYFGVYRAYDLEATLVENTVAIFYGVGDLVLIFAGLGVALLTLEYKGGKIGRLWGIFLAGLIATLLADILFAVFREGYEVGIEAFRKMDLFWITGYLLFTYSFFKMGLFIKDIQEKIIGKIKKGGE